MNVDFKRMAQLSGLLTEGCDDDMREVDDLEEADDLDEVTAPEYEFGRASPPQQTKADVAAREEGKSAEWLERAQAAEDRMRASIARGNPKPKSDLDEADDLDESDDLKEVRRIIRNEVRKVVSELRMRESQKSIDDGLKKMSLTSAMGFGTKPHSNKKNRAATQGVGRSIGFGGPGFM
jgi:hypothetical protein